MSVLVLEQFFLKHWVPREKHAHTEEEGGRDSPLVNRMISVNFEF